MCVSDNSGWLIGVNDGDDSGWLVDIHVSYNRGLVLLIEERDESDLFVVIDGSCKRCRLTLMIAMRLVC